MTDLAAIRAALERYGTMTDEVWTEFSRHLVSRKFEKDEHLTYRGRVENYLYFLVKGTARSYFLREGKEYTYDFFFPGSLFTAFTSFITRMPSQVGIQALDACTAFKIHHRFIYTLYDHYHSAERFGRIVAEQQFMNRSRKEMGILSMTAEQRYTELFERDPDLVSKISVKHLSTYLGIHPESLSRIRNKVSGRN